MTIRIWGRANSVNVQKVLWCCAELGLAFERIDAGMQFGRTHDPDYLAMNPTGRIPTLEDADFRLWESNSIMRYLALEYGGAADLYPAWPRLRAAIDRWLDWSLSTLQPTERPVFWGFVRTPPDQRDLPALHIAADAAAQLWRILDGHLGERRFVEGERFSLADVTLGAYARRWFGIPDISRPPLPAVEGWYARLEQRPAFREHVAPPLS